jgi:hypothetical protein
VVAARVVQPPPTTPPDPRQPASEPLSTMLVVGRRAARIHTVHPFEGTGYQQTSEPGARNLSLIQKSHPSPFDPLSSPRQRKTKRRMPEWRLAGRFLSRTSLLPLYGRTAHPPRARAFEMNTSQLSSMRCRRFSHLQLGKKTAMGYVEEFQ